MGLVFKNMRFKNKNVIITGSASGIGKKLYEDFAAEGARSIGFDIAEGSDYCVDVSNYKLIETAVQDILSRYQHIDIVVNCAGGNPSRIKHENVSFEQLSIDTIDWGVGVNFKGPLYMARACIGHMMERNSGVIINVGSISGVTGSAGAVDYAAEKSGLKGLTRSLALLGAPYNVRCCMVTPGPVLTRPEMAKMPTPLNRAAQVGEISDFIMYLCSDKAGFITGSEHLIDGGRSCGGLKHEK